MSRHRPLLDLIQTLLAIIGVGIVTMLAAIFVLLVNPVTWLAGAVIYLIYRTT